MIVHNIRYQLRRAALAARMGGVVRQHCTKVRSLTMAEVCTKCIYERDCK